MRTVTEVAIGVLLDGQGRFLMASRPEGKPFEGWWEFPGGKREEGEHLLQTLAREYDEELGVNVVEASPWFVFERDYPHAYVRLHVCRITKWSGEPHSREGQTWRWFASLEEAMSEKLLPFCDLVIERLHLPERVALVRDAASSTLERDFVQSGAAALMATQATPAFQALADRLAVRLIVCAGVFDHQEQVCSTDLQTALVGALSYGADATAVLKGAQQRLPLYVPSTDEARDAQALALGAQGLYVEI